LQAQFIAACVIPNAKTGFSGRYFVEESAMFAGLFAVLGRIMLALIFIISGVAKLSDISGTATYMTTNGLPASLALPVALFEVIGGIMIVLGIFTRLTALAFAAFCVLTALLFHRETADAMQATAALKNIAIAGGFLCLFAYEGKSWSLDSYRARRREGATRDAVVHPGVGAG
jgi:putative oxidoreductase